MKITIDVYEISQIPVRNTKKTTHKFTHTFFLHCTAEVKYSAAQIKNMRGIAEFEVSLRSVHSQALKNANRTIIHPKINSGAAEY